MAIGQRVPVDEERATRPAITNVRGRGVFDSNGSPTLEVEIELGSGGRGRAIAPRGSSTGEYEATFLEEADAYPALAATRPALDSLERTVAPALVALGPTSQAEVDAALNALDGTPDKSRLGGNVCVAASMAFAKAAGGSSVFRHLRPDTPYALPTPMFNVVDGSRAEGSGVPHTEFLVVPADPHSQAAAVELAVRVRDAIRDERRRMGEPAGDSPQGALLLDLGSCEEGLELLLDAAASCGLVPGRDLGLGLDLAAADFFADGAYRFPWLAGAAVDADELAARYLRWVDDYSLVYLEDGFAPSDLPAWRNLCASAPSGTLVAGDDLFASSAERIAAAAQGGHANAAVVKPNQIGTVTEALEALERAADCGFKTVVSQRTGETDDAFLTHLAVAGRADFLKAGGPARIDRIAKFNELLRLEEELG
jgi:enolase